MSERSIIEKLFQSRRLAESEKYNNSDLPEDSRLSETVVVGGNWYWKSKGTHWTQPTDKSKPRQEISAEEYKEVVAKAKNGATELPTKKEKSQSEDSPKKSSEDTSKNTKTSSYKERDDEDLVTLSKDGDKRATEEIIHRYEKFVRHLGKGLFLPGGDADDLTQEGLMGLVSAIKDYKPGKNKDFKQFAAVAIKRNMQDAIRKANAQKNSALNNYDDIDTSYDEPSDIQSPEKIYVDKEDADRLKAYMKKNLTQQENEILQYYLQNYSRSEIADMMGKSYKAIQQSFDNARKKLDQYRKKYRESKLIESVLTALESESAELMRESYDYLYN